MGFFESCKGLAAALTPERQNAQSVWGTLLAPTLPFWLLGNSGSGVAPWGGQSAETSCSNNFQMCPDTGMVRHYDFNVSRAVIAPDGYEKPVLLVNNQFPGPLIEANWGDWIEVTVTNNIVDEEEGTAMHWHGFLQEDTAWEDGTPGVTQCPIAPGKSFTYKFRATLFGTSWYHAHYSAQYAGGLFGPLVVYGPNHVDYDIDVGPIMLSDWWHRDYHKVVEEIMRPGFRGQTPSDNNLIQGKNNFDCTTVAPNDATRCNNHAGLAKFKFEKGKTHRLRFINSGAQGTERVSIDGHTMTVIANDFTPIVPYETKVITLGVGQRVDVLVTANAESGNAFWLRSDLSLCSAPRQRFSRASILYDDAPENTVPASQPWPEHLADPNTCANDALELTTPLCARRLPEPSFTQHMDIGVVINASDNFLWTMDGKSPRVNYNAPSLFSVKEGITNFPESAGIYNYGSGNSSIRVVMNNPYPAPHPMHAHGLELYVLSQGAGDWDGVTIVNPENPLRRDVQMVQGFGHIVVQFDTWNSGIWAFHCHIAWHAAQGFFLQLIFNPDEVMDFEIPESVYQTCREWDQWTSRVVVNQIDSGL